MNKSESESKLWLALLVTPMSLVADSLLNGFALGVISLLVTLTTFLCAKGLARLTSPAQRRTLLLIIAALVTGVCDLLLRAFATQIHMTIQPWLPLAAITSASLLEFSKPKEQLNDSNAATLKARIIYLLGFSLIPPLTVGATRELTGFLFILLPAGALISIALLIAAKNHWRPAPLHPESAANNPRTRRVRVTGPIS